MSQNPLLDTLVLIDTLRAGDAGALELGLMLDVSPATFKRYLADARHLGADIVSERRAGGWVYVLRNADKLRNLDAWLRFERARNDGAPPLL